MVILRRRFLAIRQAVVKIGSVFRVGLAKKEANRLRLAKVELTRVEKLDKFIR